MRRLGALCRVILDRVEVDSGGAGHFPADRTSGRACSTPFRIRARRAGGGRGLLARPRGTAHMVDSYEGHNSNLVERPMSSQSRLTGPVRLQVTGVEVTVFRKRTSAMATKECRKGKELLGAYIKALRAVREHKTALTGHVRAKRSGPVESIGAWLTKLEAAVCKVRNARQAFSNHSKKHGCYGKGKS